MISREKFISQTKCCDHPGESLFDIPREEVYPEPYRPFGKMGDHEKLLFSTVSLALLNCSLPESTAIVLVTPEGSLRTDVAFMNSVRDNFPRPALFAATLPSAPISELSIPFKLKGANRIIADNNESDGFLNALFLLEKEETDAVVLAYLAPNNGEGYAVAVIIEKVEDGIASITFDITDNSEDKTDTVFRNAVAALRGRNNFSIPVIKGTINLKVNAK